MFADELIPAYVDLTSMSSFRFCLPTLDSLTVPDTDRATEGPVPAITQTIAQLLSELETVKTDDTTPDYASPALRRLPSTFAASDPMYMTSAQGANMDIGQTALPADFATQTQTGGFGFNPNMPDLDWESIWSSVQDPNMFSTNTLFAPDLGEFFNPPPPPPQ